MRFESAVALPAEPTAEAWCFGFVQRELLLPEDGPAALVPLHPMALKAWAQEALYLGRLGGHDCWALGLAEPPPGWQPVNLRQAMMGLPTPLSALAGRAAQLLDWDRQHRFCGACGTPTERQASDRTRVCPACRLTSRERNADPVRRRERRRVCAARAVVSREALGVVRDRAGRGVRGL